MRPSFRKGIEEALQAAYSGRVLGGAHGLQHAYIDILIHDGQASLEIIQRVLREKGLPTGTEIHFFAKEKRGHRVVI
jgi:hypothetical protein